MTCTPHTQPLQEDVIGTRTAIVCRNNHDVVMAEKDSKAVREGRPAGWGGGPGGEACRVRRLEAASGCWPGGEAGLVGWRAWLEGGGS